MAFLDTTAIRADFPVFADQELHFLDSAASSQKPRQVIEAMSEFASRSYANVHRGAYRLSVEATERYEEARERLAAFLGSQNPAEVVLTRGTTTGLNLIARGWGETHLRPGDRILLSEVEHHANLIPWQMVARRTGARLDFIPLGADYRLDLTSLDRLIDGDTKVVAVTGMSNVLGTIPQLHTILDAGRSVGALTVVDGAQLVPHVPMDVTTLGADFVALSGHKMLGPTGIGVLWGRAERLEEMDPVEFGGDMISDVTLHNATWAAVPHRFEAGTPPIIEAIGLAAAVDYLDKIGMEAVASHDAAITAYALEVLSRLDHLTIHGPVDLNDRGGVISFSLADVHAHDLTTILDQRGVAVRAGHHCAKPLMRILDVPATARASFYIYSTNDDVDALAAGLDDAARLFGVA